METTNATQFKARRLTILDQLAPTGEPVVALEDGHPVAELRPVPALPATYPQHEMKGTVVELGAIVEPALSEEH